MPLTSSVPFGIEIKGTELEIKLNRWICYSTATDVVMILSC
jgi:hypothetical protein